jgi:hypothetical protein
MVFILGKVLPNILGNLARWTSQQVLISYLNDRKLA